MILHDYQCQTCNEVSEHFVDSGKAPDQRICPICSGKADKVFLSNSRPVVDPPWIAGVREVVDKKSDKPWVKEFLRHPTRANLKAYMDKEGLRHMDKNEPAFPKIDREARKRREQKGMLDMYMKRNALSVNTK